MRVIGNRYQIEQPLGKGGMGEVFKAFDRLTNTSVALKSVTHIPQGTDIGAEESYEHRLGITREFKTLASLRHPQIISVLDYGFDEAANPFFTMELLENATTLYNATTNLPVDAKIDLIIQTLQALAYLHRRGVLHHDLKPHNIMVMNNRVKVLDFGLSISYEQATLETDKIQGTLLYLAPEVLNGKPYSIAADLYAMGVILYEVLAGKPPFQSENMGQLVTSILRMEPDLEQLYEISELIPITAKLLSKRPEERYISAHSVMDEICKARQRPLPKETQEIRESYLQAANFVGRTIEFSQLQTAFENALIDQNGSAWLIGGESGVGKSRLLDELRTHALVQGALVLRGQAVSAGGMPFHIWRSILRHMVLTTSTRPDEQIILKSLIPDLETLLEVAIPNAETEPTQQALFHVIMELFRRQKAPMLVILEDLHWATEESMGLLKQLISIVSRLPILAVGNYRDDEAPHLADQLSGMNILKLQRLPKHAITDLSISMLGRGGERPEIIEFLAHQTEGNIFFMVEVMRALADRAGGLDNISTMSLPKNIFAGGIQDFIERRLTSVSSQSKQLLNIAAIIGRQIDLAIMEAIYPDTDMTRFLNECNELAILEVVDGQWQFSHDKLRDGVLLKLSSKDKVRLHKEVALTIERLYPNQIHEHVNALAFHWAEAKDIKKDRYYAWLAGKQACVLSSFKGARGYLERALRFYKKSIDVEDQRILANIQSLLGDCYVNLGFPIEGIAYLEEALAIGRSLDDAPIIGDTLRSWGIADFRMGKYSSARQKLQESFDLSRNLNQRAEMATAVYFLGAVDTFEDKLIDAQKHIEEALAIRLELNDQWGVARAYNGLGEVALALGNFADAEFNYKKALAIFEEMKDQWWIGATRNNLGHSGLYLKNYEDALQYLHSAIETSHNMGALPITLKALAGVAHFMILQNNAFLGAQIAYFVLEHENADGDGKHKAEKALQQHQEPDAPEFLAKAKEASKDLTLPKILTEILPML